MFDSLRSRLILSHILPLLVIIPLMGIALIYVLETVVLLPELAAELTGQAQLVAKLTGLNNDLWTNPAQAQTFVDEVSRDLPARLMLLDAAGRLLASSDPTDSERVGQIIELSALTESLSGQFTQNTSYSRHLRTDIADVLFPVFGPDQQVVGVIRLSHQLAGVQELFLRVRYLIVGVLVTGLLFGLLVGLLLALDMERPLQRVTQAIYGLTQGEQFTTLAEGGPREIRVLLRSLNLLVERLRGLEQARRQLLANLVHELGRPLGAVNSAIEALTGRSGADPEVRQELLTGIRGEIRRLERLLEDLAHLHDQVLGILELDRQVVTISAWLPQVLIPWRQAAEHKGLHWQTDIAANLPPLKADPDRLAQVVGNLLSNAIKYSPPQGTITVSASQEQNGLRIRICDTGPGIPLEEQDKIFQPLYRGSSGGRFPQGMGLGLAIAHDLVEAHGGHLELQSTPGQGSCFTIWLP